ncbi:hypothetical protein BDEG_23954 [Batrachochytrium dendrobatidis JEL423]|uniref:Recombination protein rad52 n=2 Tax=Batrachochytrium dendrobatidis TaxID=109871 RepID=A0A177WL57_BATDL|nr:hypothetical protein BDEG_23954 [Batrachochytrium dendrobatidis JEL423]
MNNSRLAKRELDNSSKNAAIDPRHFTEAQRQEIVESLAMKLGPEFMSHRSGPGGSKLTYLEGWKSINLANDIFGFDGWSSSVIDQTVDFLDNDNGKYSLGVSAIVRVTLKDGTFHEDVGYGSIENSRSKIAAFEKAKKEAVTDSLKRALRCFGNSLGNCFYDKNYMKKLSKLPVPKQKPVTVADLYRHNDFLIDTPGHPAKEAPPIETDQVKQGTNMPIANLKITPPTKDPLGSNVASSGPTSINAMKSNEAVHGNTTNKVTTNTLELDQLDDEMDDDDDLFLMAADLEYIDSNFLTDTNMSPHHMNIMNQGNGAGNLPINQSNHGFHLGQQSHGQPDFNFAAQQQGIHQSLNGNPNHGYVFDRNLNSSTHQSNAVQNMNGSFMAASQYYPGGVTNSNNNNYHAIVANRPPLNPNTITNPSAFKWPAVPQNNATINQSPSPAQPRSSVQLPIRPNGLRMGTMPRLAPSALQSSSVSDTATGSLKRSKLNFGAGTGSNSFDTFISNESNQVAKSG